MTVDELYQAFLAAAGQQGDGGSPAGFGLADLIAQLGAAPQSAVTTAGQALSRKPAAQTQGGGESPVLTVLKNAFAIPPLIGGLISLFGGGGDDTPPPLVKYALPSAVNFDAAETPEGGFTVADYGQGGTARPYTSP